MTAPRLAFVAPRYAEGPTVGGAETLLRNLALRAGDSGSEVTFLTTCARNHFTWANEVPAGTRRIGSMEVKFFPVDEDRDLATFLAVQDRISRRRPVSRDEEMAWLRNNVNSSALYAWLRENATRFDRIVVGPYLFGLTYFVAALCPEKTVLVPCLHDEAFAYLAAFRDMFRSVHGFMFNTAPERDLAVRLYGDLPRAHVVGMGIDAFKADPRAFAAARGLDAPYVIYSGRREPLKGTPLLIDYLHAFVGRTERNVKLVLTGTGPVQIPTGFESRVLDAGFVTEEEKHDAMAGAVAFCHPSCNESLGIVLLESWLAGTPALVHAGSDVLRHQCRESNGGLWFRTYPEFEEELLLLLDRPDVRTKMGEAGRRFVLREYAWDSVEGRMGEALRA